MNGRLGRLRHVSQEPGHARLSGILKTPADTRGMGVTMKTTMNACGLVLSAALLAACAGTTTNTQPQAQSPAQAQAQPEAQADAGPAAPFHSAQLAQDFGDLG